VIDGDGLTNLAKAFENNSKNIQDIFQNLFDKGKYIVLTPHIGELKHLFWPSNEESDVAIVEHSVKLESSEEQVTFIDYVYKTREILKNLGGDFSNKLVVVVKGSTSCVVDGTSAIRMNVTGNAGMGTAGSGDVLSGVVANMLIRCSHLDVIDAVANAVWIHGRAGDLARNELGEDGMVASDILDHLPQVMKEMSSETGNPEWNNYYPKIY
jgi:NAD(P)H-hydrate epimerase